MRVVRGGVVTDGEHRPYPGDVIIEGDRVTDVVVGGLGTTPDGADILEAEGLWVTPGFVDMHAHDDVAAAIPDVYEGKIRQGVTTVAVTMDGFGYAAMPEELREPISRYWRPVDGDPGPAGGATLGAYAERLEGSLGPNLALGVPHANLRIEQAGFDLRDLTGSERARARERARALAAEGAFGLTTGLSYVPAVASSLEELVDLGRGVREGGGRLYVTHLRDYGRNLFRAVDEAISVGRETGLRVHLSHLHLSHPDRFGQGELLLERLCQARADGVPVTWDTYPYQAGSSILYSYLPAWVQDGGPDALLRRLGEPDVLRRLEADRDLAGFGWGRVVIASTPDGREAGESVAALSERRGESVVRTVARILREADLDVSCIVHQTQEADDLLIAEADGCVVGTDGLPFGARRHPRYTGAMAAYYRRHVVERRAFDEGGTEAVRRMSTRATGLLGIERAGPYAGARADLAVWDPAGYRDRSTYDHPDVYAEGMRHVLVAGVPVLRDGKFDPSARPGQWLRSRPDR